MSEAQNDVVHNLNVIPSCLGNWKLGESLTTVTPFGVLIFAHKDANGAYVNMRFEQYFYGNCLHIDMFGDFDILFKSTHPGYTIYAYATTQEPSPWEIGFISADIPTLCFRRNEKPSARYNMMLEVLDSDLKVVSEVLYSIRPHPTEYKALVNNIFDLCVPTVKIGMRVKTPIFDFKIFEGNPYERHTVVNKDDAKINGDFFVEILDTAWASLACEVTAENYNQIRFFPRSIVKTQESQIFRFVKINDIQFVNTLVIKVLSHGSERIVDQVIIKV